METPEKIYLEWYRIGDKKYREWVITPKTNNEPVEYTRTDAIIEKVKKAMIEWAGTYVSKTGKGVKERKTLAFDLLNYFEKYMEEPTTPI